MKFSVLMSVYGKDNSRFFEEALKSVTVNQTVRPAQVVIVEDGPVPNEIDSIIESISELISEVQFCVIKKDTNQGLASALNTGLKECKYEWIARMDSDDIACRDRFEKQINYIKSNKKVAAVGGAIAEFENRINDINSKRQVKLKHNEIIEMMKTRNPMNHVSVMFRKFDVEEIGGYCENFGKLEDYKLWVDLVVAGKELANIDDILVNVRVGNGFIERRSEKREIKDWDMLQKYLKEKELIGPYKAILNSVSIRMFIYMPCWMKKIAYKMLLRK